MKNVKKILLGVSFFYSAFLFVNTEAFAACKDGQSSTGRQSWGGSGNGRWELVCSGGGSATCCFSHDNRMA